jgi:EAL domain-containing protein (putative c-di-GMP-specific phosphodiesterase class I)
MYLRRPPRHSAAVSIRRASSLFGSVEMVFQPIIDVANGQVVAAEALARFPTQPDAPIEETFALAHASGRGPELEAACLRAALRARITQVPAEVVITLNVSPDALAHPSVQSALTCDLTGVIIEVTEHASADLAGLQASLEELRGRGAQIAIDDASTGYAGLLRLTALRPEFVKLDRGLVAGARTSLEQSAVIEALVSLSRRIGARVLGEGVECADDLAAMAELDVDFAQGFFIAPPMFTVPRELPAIAESCREIRGALLRTESSSGSRTAAGIRSVTAALAASDRLTDLQVALLDASKNLGIDVISMSTLTPSEVLYEISCAGSPIDAVPYPLVDYPATKSALATGVMAEAHLQDPRSDAAERALMAADGIASLLLTPVIGHGERLGILEFRHRTHRRWTSHDMTQARILAEHIASVLVRMAGRERRIEAIAG